MRNLLICLYLSIIYTANVNSSFCYWNVGCPYKYFSSKTSYSAVRGDIRDSLVRLNGCEPVSIWGLYRHGKMYPDTDLANKIKRIIVIRDYVVSSYSKGKSSLCAQDVDNLRDWTIDNNMFEKINELSDEGKKEMIAISKRLKQAFPKLLANIDTGTYTIGIASGNSIKDSAESFISSIKKGLTIDKSNDYDDIIAPYKKCKKYQTEIKNNADSLAEIDKYLDTTDFLAAKDRIQRRLGIEYALTNENITTLYDLCRYVWSGDNKMSPWCALFTTDDLKVLEYIGDLRSYYESGHGNAMNELFGRVPLTNLLKSFQQVRDGKGKKITAYFTDSSMLDMVYTTLGVFKDKHPLTGAVRDPERKWRGSKLSIPSGNLVAVLKRCSKDRSEDYNIVFYVNEEPVRSICAGGVCSWEEFEDKFKHFVNTTIDLCG